MDLLFISWWQLLQSFCFGGWFCFALLGFSLTKSQSTLQWTTHPSTQTVETGNDVQFRCSATYDRKVLKYHWQHESATIQADSEPRFTIQADGTLVITNVKVEDRGTYHCYVTRDGRDKILGRSNIATLTVRGACSAVQLSIKPSGNTFLTGTDLILRCKCYMNPSGTYAFIKYGVPVSTDGRITLDRNKLFINNANGGDSGTYSCSAITRDGNVKNSTNDFSISVVDGGSITWFEPPPVDTTADSNVIRTYNTSILKGSTNVKLNWNFSLTQVFTFASLRLELDNNLVATVISSGQSYIAASFRRRVNVRWIPQKVSLTILKVSTHDDGEFSCIVNTVGRGLKQWTRKIKVTVLVPAKLTNVSQDQTVREGSDLQLFCKASGKPAPNITWTMAVRNGSESEVQHRGSTWNMANIKRTNQGTYRCTAYNGVRNADSSVANINVTYPAKIIKRQNNTAQVRGYAALICQSEGNPTPVITWTRDKTNEIVGYGSTLVFCSAQFYDGGWYKCSSENSLGKDRASVYLEVIEKGITLINVTMTISNEKYHEDIERLGSEKSQSLVARIKEAVKAVFKCDSSFENTDVIGFRPGSVIVSFVLTFKEPVTEEHVMSMLKAAAESGNLGTLKVNGSSIVASEEYGLKKTPTTTRSTPVQVCNGCSCNYTIFIAVVVILVAVIIVLLTYIVWLHRKVARIKKRAHPESPDEKTTVQMAKLEPNLNETRQQELQGSSRVQYMDLDDARRSHDIPGASQTNTPQISQYAPLHPSTLSWEISRQHVKIEKVIGKGAFGQVAKGKAVGLRGIPQETLVAVKMLKADAPESDKKDLLSELEVMKTLKPHPHVIKLLGCVTESEPLLVLIEYVPYGDLLGYLRKSRGLNDTYYKDPDIKPQTSLTSQQLIKFAWQVADGMSYLSSRSIIHRDLAARNVLIGERETCKVTDFGMARDVQHENIYERKTKGRLPVKWTAYEALLYGKYTTKSDIWSYGVLLYEIFTIGGSPYPRMDGRKIASLLQQGYRMPKPQHVDDELYKIMMMCWEEEPDARPTFLDLRNKLKKMDKHNKKYINMNMYDTKLYANLEDLVV